MFPFFMSFASITFQNKTANTADRSCSPQDARRVQLPAAYSILAQMSFPTHKKSSQPYVLYSRCLFRFFFDPLRYRVHRILSLEELLEQCVLAVELNGEDLCKIKAQYSEKRLRINDHTVIKYIHIKITAGNAHKLLCLVCRRKFYFFCFIIALKLFLLKPTDVKYLIP